MSRPTFEVADIVRTHGKPFIDRYRSRLGFQQLKALNAIASLPNCGTRRPYR